MVTRNRKPKQLTDEDIDALPIKKAGTARCDTEQRGLHIRVTPSGVKTFWALLATPMASRLGKRLGTP